MDDSTARFFADPAHDETHNFEILSMADEYYWTHVARHHNIPFTREQPVMYDVWPIQQASRQDTLDHFNAAMLRAKNGHLFAREVNRDTRLELDWMDAITATTDVEETTDGEASSCEWKDR